MKNVSAKILNDSYALALIGKGGPALSKAVAVAMVGAQETLTQSQRKEDAIGIDTRLSAQGRLEQIAAVRRAAGETFDKIAADVGGRLGNAAKEADRIAAHNVTISKRERTPEVVQREYLHVLPGLASMSPAELIGIMLTAAERGDTHGDEILDAIEFANPLLYPVLAAIPPDIRVKATETRQRKQNPAACDARDELRSLEGAWTLYSEDMKRALGLDELGRDPLVVLMEAHKAEEEAKQDALDEALVEAVDGVTAGAD